MRRFLCLDCLSPLARRRGHVCRIPYPKTGPCDMGIARIGVLNLLGIRRLWLRSWRAQAEQEGQ